MTQAKGDFAPVQNCIFDELSSLFFATRAELALFFAAVVAYLLLFGNTAPKGGRQRRGAKAKQHKVVVEDAGSIDDDSEIWSTDSSKGFLSAAERERLEQAFDAAFAAGDHRQVLRCWAALRRSDSPPAVSLSRAVESMQRLKKDRAFVLRELKAHFQRHPSSCLAPGALAGLVEPLARRPDADLVAGVLEAAEEAAGARPDERCFEALLSMHCMTKNFTQVRLLLNHMEKNGMGLTTKARLVAVKTALNTGDLLEAFRHFAELKILWSTASESTPSMAPQNMLSQLVDLACGERRLGDLLALLEEGAGAGRCVPLGEDVAKAMLVECVRRKDCALSQRAERLIRRSAKLSDGIYALLARCAAFGDGGSPVAQLDALVDEMADKGTPLSAEFILAALGSCGQHPSGTQMADRLLERSNLQQPSVLSTFIRFYSETENFDKACDLYERSVSAASAGQGSEGVPQPPAAPLDARAERCLMNAALRCGRDNLAKSILDACPADVARHIAMVRSCAARGDLDGAHEVFANLSKTGAEVNSVVYNTVLDACVECRDLRAAEEWMAHTKKAGRADVVSYNTLIKAHLRNDNFRKARDLVAEMRAEGFQPNRITFNELANGLVSGARSGDATARRAELWDVVKEMRAAGVKPNQVTCSILLKGLNARSKHSEINETMDLIADMDEPMDEVLLSSVVEACVRIGQPELLAQKLRQFQGGSGAEGLIRGSHTFGSLIKAYGHAKDMDGVWRCWKEMCSRHIRPTAITLGCMVEAVVSNGDTESAYDVIQEIREDESRRDVLNAVMYCSVLKGFTREKRIERVWAVYEEMLAMQVELSPVTYNTLLDACARCSRMDRATGIMEDMKAHRIQPNLITYSTLVKGYCLNGDVDRGFSTLDEMCRATDFKPDEIMYNSLIDGCAQGGAVDRGLALLERMQREGVPPSNFTLSLLVKLMSRARRLDGAFSLVEDISKKYGIRPNVHVFTNLIQACIANRQPQRGMAAFERMLKDRVRPESRSIAILARASLAQGAAEQAAGILRAALGLPAAGLSPIAEDLLPTAIVSNLDPAIVSEALQGLADRGRLHDLAVPLLADIRSHRPQVRIDAATQRRLVSAGVASTTGSVPPSSWESGPHRGGRLGTASGSFRGGRGGGGGGRPPRATQF